jgi:hypothetical protein
LGPGEALSAFLDSALASRRTASRNLPYVALQAFLKPAPETTRALQDLRARIRDVKRVTCVLGYGPRYLHSTGQLHKGDAGHGVFIQFSGDMPRDVPIPDDPGAGTSSLTFGLLKTAQALGDLQALEKAGRDVIHFQLGSDIPGGLHRLAAAL